MDAYKLKITMTPAQARHIERALDFYERICMGQFEEVITVLNTVHHCSFWDYVPVLNLLKRELGLPPNASLGIANEKTHHWAKEMYDMQKTIQKAIATAEQHDKMSVWHDGNWFMLGKEPVMEIETLEPLSGD